MGGGESKCTWTKIAGKFYEMDKSIKKNVTVWPRGVKNALEPKFSLKLNMNVPCVANMHSFNNVPTNVYYPVFTYNLIPWNTLLTCKHDTLPVQVTNNNLCVIPVIVYTGWVGGLKFLAHLVMSLCNHALSIMCCCHHRQCHCQHHRQHWRPVYSPPSDRFDHRSFISYKYMQLCP